MDTNSNISVEKRVVSVEILHLSDLGYGPRGQYTRRQWRKRCFFYLLNGKQRFEAWQQRWKRQIVINLPKVSFEAEITYSDGSQFSVLNGIFSTRLPYTLDFVFSTFRSDLQLIDHNFQHEALFTGAIFDYGTDFSQAIFHADADFSNATFNGKNEFEGAKFNHSVDFSNAIFNDNTFTNIKPFPNFNLIKNGSANFNDVIFSGIANFYGINFQGDAYFRNTKFLESVTFSGANFSEYGVNFYNTIFTRRADFRVVKFGGTAYFDSATFNNDVDFAGVIFIGHANFSSAEFKGDAKFCNASFFQYADFPAAKFSQVSDFSKCKFSSCSSFQYAAFEFVAHFEEAIFVDATPRFRGCKIEATRVEFSDDSYFPLEEKSDEAVRNISFLKRLSDEHGQSEQALNFNAMELRAKRLQTEPQPAALPFKAITWLYEVFSDYGRSFVRPLLGYGALIVCSLLLTLPLTDYSQDTTPVAVVNRALCIPKDKDEAAKLLQLTHGRAAFEYALFRAGGVLDFTDTGKQNNTVNCTLFGQPIEPSLMRAWGIFKGIASITLLFLAALGLRNKYRIK